MKLAFLTLIVLQSVVLAAPAPVAQLNDFELTDQHLKTRAYRFPKTKVTVMAVADHKGSDQLAPWIQRLYDRYENRIDIDGVANVSMIPKPFHNMFRAAFRKQLTYSVMLDWDGSLVKQLGYEKGLANVYVIDRGGRVVKQVTGPASNEAMREIAREIDRAISGTSPK